MEGLIEKAKEDNPEYLRQQIAELKKELEMARKQMKTKEVPVLNERDFKRLVKLLEPLSTHLRGLEQRLEKIDPTKQYAAPMLVQNDPQVAFSADRTVQLRPLSELTPSVTPRPVKVVNGEKKITGKAIEMLRILALYPEGLTRIELAVRSVITQSGTYSNYISDLRSAGYVEDGQGGRMIITANGIKAAKQYFPAGLGSKPTSAELVSLWKERYLTGKAKDMIDIVFSLRGQYISRQNLFNQAFPETVAQGGKMHGTYSNYISDIHSSGLVEKTIDGIRASRALMTA